ncbi:HD domain-containing protein, partial [archaeon]
MRALCTARARMRVCVRVCSCVSMQLKQLGTAYYVYPGASHNRFEHSLGVSYLSGAQIDYLAHSQPELRVTDEDKMLVRIAGLVHDLGHGPFSHVFDSLFIPTVRPDRAAWSHEVMSAELFEALLDDNGIDLLDEHQRRCVQRLVLGAKAQSSHAYSAPGVAQTVTMAAGFGGTRAQVHTTRTDVMGAGGDGGNGSAGSHLGGDEKMFLFDIVANGRTGIDTDKWDYLARDTYNIGHTSAFDHRRLLYSSRVVEDRIAYHAKEVMAVYEMFHTRYSLFKACYVHRATKAVEFMITDGGC